MSGQPTSLSRNPIPANNEDQTKAAAPRLVFVDVDNTLIRSDVLTHWRYFASHTLSPLNYIARLILMYLRAPYYLWLDRRDRAAFNILFYQQYKGLNQQKLLRLAEASYEKVTQPRLKEHVVGAIRAHQAAGDRLILISGSLDLVVEPLAHSLGISEVIVPRLEFQHGYATGRLKGKPLAGPEKAKMMRRFALAQQADLANSVAYADSFSDLPLLASTGYPVAVDPDRNLAKYAREHGWTILRSEEEKPARLGKGRGTGMKDLRGKNALLTGGSRGMGPLIAEALAREGVNVALVARSEEQMNIVVAKLISCGVRAAGIKADITNENDQATIVQRAEAALGPIDILINNAGAQHIANFARIDPREIEEVFRLNTIAPMQLTRRVLPGMIERGQGHIVTMSSIAGKVSVAYNSLYAASKAALIEWTAGLRGELDGTGVSASVICPTFVSGEGMFAVYGIHAHWFAGEIPAQKVVKAVIRALKEDRQEILVVSMPIRPSLALSALLPGVKNMTLKYSGVVAFFRRLAHE